MLPSLLVLSALAGAPPIGLGLEVQRNNSSRGVSGLENAALADARQANEDAGLMGAATNSKAGVSENAVLATVSIDHPLGEHWIATGVVGLGWASATGEAEIESGAANGQGFRWTIASPLVEVGGGLRRTFGTHWAAATELSLSRGILGSGKFESFPPDRTLDEGDVGESGTFLEDVSLAWRFRLKLGPQARYGRFSAFPWLAIGSTPVMTSDSRIAGFDADEDPEWTKLGFGLRLGWSL